MAERTGPGETADSFWSMMADIARLQRQMGRDMAAWAHVYQLAGEAMQGNAETLALMADLGQRGERFTRTGPPAAARQAMQMFMNPLGMVAPPGAAAPAANPFARFWESWAAGLPGGGGSSE